MYQRGEDLSLGNGPFPFNNPLLFVIPSEAEGSAVRHSDASNLPFYNHFPFVVPREAEGSAVLFLSLNGC
jgi:hypothetical protein